MRKSLNQRARKQQPSLKHINSHLNLAKLINCRKVKLNWTKRHLMQPKFLAALGLYSSIYSVIIYKSYMSNNEILRIAGSGSLTFLICEIFFFPLDALNLQQKIQKANLSTRQMLQQVYRHYGPYGVYRGFTTSYYSSTSAAYIFFVVYKGLKTKLKEKFKPRTQSECTFIYTAASFIAEAVSLCIYYPYEILKVRLIAKND